MENWNRLIVAITVWEATGTAERFATRAVLQQVLGTGRVTVDGDTGMDAEAPACL